MVFGSTPRELSGESSSAASAVAEAEAAAKSAEAAAAAAAAVAAELESRHESEQTRLKQQHLREIESVVGEVTELREKLREGREDMLSEKQAISTFRTSCPDRSTEPAEPAPCIHSGRPQSRLCLRWKAATRRSCRLCERRCNRRNRSSLRAVRQRRGPSLSCAHGARLPVARKQVHPGGSEKGECATTK